MKDVWSPKTPGRGLDAAPGLAARRVAADILDAVLRRHRPLDELFDSADLDAGVSGFGSLPERDRALARMLVATVLRRLGTLRHLIGRFLERGVPPQAPRVETALLIGAAQILFLKVPDHAAVDLAVRLAQSDRAASRFSGLINAVLRRVVREGGDLIGALYGPELDTPRWLMARWVENYGDTTARAIAAAHAGEPALDLTVKGDPDIWAARLGGRVVATGSVRLVGHGLTTSLPGFADGQWWVQDAAAALPARLLGRVHGLQVADLCAAPGGKTAQLLAAGARVTAVDRAPSRIARLRDNLARLSFDAEIVCADVGEWEPGQTFDAVLLDVPCSSTGTIRRRPDVPWLKSSADVIALAALQRRLLGRAAALLRPGGTLVYCTCSLEPEECECVIADLLARDARMRRQPIAASEIFDQAEFITERGDLRTLPCHWPESDSRLAGLDGFYAARLQKQ